MLTTLAARIIDLTGFFRDRQGVYQPLTLIVKDRDDWRRGRPHVNGPPFNSPQFDRRRLKRQRRTNMALKVELKPHERIIIGSCVVTNTDQRARLLIDGDNIPILREKDILTPETANTPAKLVYLAVQLMYISPDPQNSHGTYFNLLRDIVVTVPSAWPIIEGINNCILSGDLYQALKEAKKLIAYEQKLLEQHEAIEANRQSEVTARRSA
jgi:flagellar protein FlbT